MKIVFRMNFLIVIILMAFLSVARAEPVKEGSRAAQHAGCIKSRAIDVQLSEIKRISGETYRKCATPLIHEEKLARRGCCSHHGGVCGCSSGRAVCCDGQFSPSCGCD